MLFTSLVAENAGGTFSFADVDSSVTAGAFAEPVAGVTPTDTWVLQTAWNTDKMNGTGPSKMLLDPTKGNVFKIAFQYLGYGEQDFYIEDSVTGKFQLVHRFRYANENTTPWCQDPTFHLNLIAKTESGYGGGALTMKTSSMAGFIQGQENPDGVRRGVAVTESITTSEAVFLIIVSNYVFNSRKNKITTFPDIVSIANESGTKDLTINLKKNPTSITGSVANTSIQPGVSTMEWSQTGTVVVGGANLLSFVVAPESELVVNLADLRAKIRPGERYVFTGTGGGALIASISITWVERI
jgi:hypothetical protein